MTQGKLEIRRSDILAADDLEAIVNPVNCVGTMGKGLALQFLRRYPQIKQPYQAVCRQGQLTTERPQVLQVNEDQLPRYIVNLATKVHWKNPSRLEWIDQGLQSMYRQLTENAVTSVGLPALGAGLGGLPFEKVRQLIEKHAELNPDVRTILFLPSR